VRALRVRALRVRAGTDIGGRCLNCECGKCALPADRRACMARISTLQKSINVNTMSIVWYLPLVAYEVWGGGMLASPALWEPQFW